MYYAREHALDTFKSQGNPVLFTPMKQPRRSQCPISYSLELFGDRWSLLILRDLAFRDARHFQDFLDSPEGIASNILSERLARLEAHGIVEKHADPEDGRRNVYSLGRAGLDLIPVSIQLPGEAEQETSVLLFKTTA